METMNRYIDLIEAGTPLERPTSRTSPSRALEVLRRTADERSGLPLDGAWRLDRETARELARREEFVPPGGWRRLAALAAGSDMLDATHDEFEAGERPAPDDETARRVLIEAFSRRLVPPTTAAGLFILLGLHPAWGVHLAHVVNDRSDRPAGDPAEPADRDELFPEQTLETVRETVFSTLSALVATFRRLQPGEAYPVDDLARFVQTLCRRTRRGSIDDTVEQSSSGLAAFVGNPEEREGENWRVTDFAANDLLDAWLVPAGAARRFNDGTFCVFPDAFDGARVDDRPPTEQAESLNRLLESSSQNDVA